MSRQQFPGRPEELFHAARELTRQGERLRGHSRTTSRSGAQASQSWLGSGSLAYAHRSHGHVRATGAGAAGLTAAGAQASRFASEMKRIQTTGGQALTRRGRWQRELLEVLREAPLAGAAGRVDLAREAADLRRKIAYEDGLINGLQKDLIRLKKEFGNALQRLVPPEMYQWWVLANTGKTALEAASSMVKPGAATARLLNAVKAHQKATAAGDTTKAAAALRQIVQARKALLPPGHISKSRARVKKAVASPPGQRVMNTAPVRRVTDHRVVKAIYSSPAATAVRRVAGPLGAADTMYSGFQDARTGDGHDGARGAITRVTGAGAMVGAPLLLVTGATPAGAVLVGGWLVWKGANAVYDNRASIRRFVGKITSPFRRKPAPKPAVRESAARLRTPRPYLGPLVARQCGDGPGWSASPATARFEQAR